VLFPTTFADPASHVPLYWVRIDADALLAQFASDLAVKNSLINAVLHLPDHAGSECGPENAGEPGPTRARSAAARRDRYIRGRRFLYRKSCPVTIPRTGESAERSAKALGDAERHRSTFAIETLPGSRR